MGMVTMYRCEWCCKEVYIIIDILKLLINFTYSTCTSSSFGSSIPTSLFIFKNVFSFLFMLFLYNIQQTLLKEHSRTFKKSRSREYNWRAEASLPCLLNYPNFRYIY